jgi:hypothetical protein
MCVRIFDRGSGLSIASWIKGCFSRSLMPEKTIPIFDPANGAAKRAFDRSAKNLPCISFGNRDLDIFIQNSDGRSSITCIEARVAR